jgi:ribosomal protein S18 acetylase RimI-like enzyme
VAGVPAVSGPFTIRPTEAGDQEWIDALVTAAFGAAEVVSRGVRHRPAALPGYIAETAGERAGLVTVHVDGPACEVVTLNAMRAGRGAGTALLEAAVAHARAAGCRRMWLITTNDNLRALRFYQRRGMHIGAVHRGAVDAARALKPEIPLTGEFDIPIHDEIEMVMNL